MSSAHFVARTRVACFNPSCVWHGDIWCEGKDFHFFHQIFSQLLSDSYWENYSHWFEMPRFLNAEVLYKRGSVFWIFHFVSLICLFSCLFLSVWIVRFKVWWVQYLLLSSFLVIPIAIFIYVYIDVRWVCHISVQMPLVIWWQYCYNKLGDHW